MTPGAADRYDKDGSENHDSKSSSSTDRLDPAEELNLTDDNMNKIRVVLEDHVSI